MKTRILLSIIALGLFSSCIVKSIQPYYIKSKLKYNTKLVGEWKDQRNSTWNIVSFKSKWKEDNKDPSKLMKEDFEAYERYKDGYIISYERSKKQASFIAMPFMVDDYLFIDVTPFEYESDDINSLAAEHLLKTHSTAYVQFNSGKSIVFKWLSESVMNRLFEEQKLRLKHEESGVDNDLILTASSEELYQFLRKFMKTEIDNKWDNDDVYKLEPYNAAP
ncbi:hypothetical protein [Winogradskyella sp. A3E31]|uniref:hypothetical protein n=1 Tax=Winogradskyella sp. A3E31 TaxID=3349637 RepID=UPI00398B6CFA